MDQSATLPGALAVNTNNQFVLRSIANNQQSRPPDCLPYALTMPFSVEYWRSHTTLPIDLTSSTRLYIDPQVLVRVQATQYPPQGQPVTIEMLLYGYQLRGEWHVGYLNNVIYYQQCRNKPDIYPTWDYC